LAIQVEPFLSPGGEAGSLGAAVRSATHRALAARDQLLQSYPQWQAWRQQAREIKREAIGRLDELLPRLKSQVEAWGGQVLWARDAAQARQLILEVARRHQVREVVKAKSMTAAEIGLNPALATAGLGVTETDLGEFLIQVAGHAPAHLTAPALHLNRQQIARLLEEKLNLSCPPEPEALSREASRYIKPRYAGAQMGITGVNFASAADGTLVFLENESNLRWSAVRPPVHLALMGVEKLLPSLQDFQVFLRLLPASATGQRLTALVHFLRGLKAGAAGAQAFYLVLLDNGRRRLAANPELAEALYCLRCGACLNICPVFQAGGAYLYHRVYPGPIGILLASYLAPLGDISDLCTQCGACGDLCPVAIPLPDKIRHVRGQSAQFRGFRALSRTAGLVLSLPRLYRRLEPGLRFLPRLLPGSLGGDLQAALALESFHRRHPGLAPGRGGEGLGGESPGPRAPGPSLGPGGRAGRGDEAESAAPTRPPPPPATLLKTRLEEVGGRLHRVRGPGALARLLAARAREPLWLEDHPWLRSLAARLGELGLKPQFAGDVWAPAVDTVVSVGLGAVPETGSVLLAPRPGPDSWLPFKARKQVVLVAQDRAGLSLEEAVEHSRGEGPGLTTWVTGPSRTADIEKVLVLGAQGPEELEVVLYQSRS
jgi:L-lactate dehydrogenase complex protein LldF